MGYLITDKPTSPATSQWYYRRERVLSKHVLRCRCAPRSGAGLLTQLSSSKHHLPTMRSSFAEASLKRGNPRRKDCLIRHAGPYPEPRGLTKLNSAAQASMHTHILSGRGWGGQPCGLMTPRGRGTCTNNNDARFIRMDKPHGAPERKMERTAPLVALEALLLWGRCRT